MAKDKYLGLNGLKTYDGEIKSYIDSIASGKANSSHDHVASNITSGTLSEDRLPVVPITKGGTGAATAADALTHLGLTATAAELNKMDGVTATTAELNYVDGVTSNIQTQLNAKVPTSRTVNGKALSANITLSASDVGADASGSASSALTSAKSYTDGEISKLVNNASTETLDSIAELADAIEENDTAIEALNSVAASKANASDLTSHTGNKSNPHGVTKAQVGLGSVENKSSAAIRGELTKANVTDALGYTPPTTNTTYSVVSTTADGLAPKRSGTTTKFLRDDGTWAVPTNTTYSAGTGISLSGTTFSNSGVRNITPSTANGGICFDLNGTTKEVFVCGLKSAAYTESSAYAAASHSHSYLPLSGGTLTGSLGLGANSLIVGGATFSYDQTSHVLDIAKTSGNTASAIGVKLGTKTVGSATQPIYFNAGTPTACTYTLGKSVPSDAKFTDTVYTLPNATASVLGGVKVGSNISVSSGTISLTKANVTAALGYTPPTSDTNTTYSAGIGISLSGTTFSNSGVRSIATGSSNGTISVNTNGTSANVAVKGLGSAAYTASTAYAAASHTHSYLPLSGGTLTGSVLSKAVYPKTNNSYSCGTSSYRWSTVYSSAGNFSGAMTLGSTVSIAGITTISKRIQPAADGDETGYVQLGAPDARFKYVYCMQSAMSTSDLKAKRDLTNIDDRYIELFNLIEPYAYYFNNGDRVHTGFIAQYVEDAMEKVGLTAEELGFFCKDHKVEYIYDDDGHLIGEEKVYDEDGNPVYTYALRYEEYIAIMAEKIKRLEKKYNSKLEELEKRLEVLEA